MTKILDGYSCCTSCGNILQIKAEENENEVIGLHYYCVNCNISFIKNLEKDERYTREDLRKYQYSRV